MNSPSDKPVRFLVTCFGNSASGWLGTAFNQHEDIYCTHGSVVLSHKPVSRDDKTAWHSKPALDRQVFLNRKISDTFSELEEHQPEARAYGNVHGYRAAHLPAVLKKFPEGNLNIQCLNLVRHPVSWTASCAANYLKSQAHSIFMRNEMLSVCANRYNDYQAWTTRHGLDVMAWEHITYYVACVYLKSLREDFEACRQMNISFIKKERITTEPDFYRETLAALTNNTCSISDNYLDEVFGRGIYNQHNESKHDSEADQFASWTDAQREVFSALMKESGLREAYKLLKYSFDYT